MKEAEFLKLMQKYVADELTETEFSQLWNALRQPGHREAWTVFMHQVWEQQGAGMQGEDLKKESLANVMKVLHEGKRRGMIKKLSWWAAAACMIGLSAGAFLFNAKKNTPAVELAQAVTPKTPIRPGGNHAMLTLADGSVIELDSAANGVLGQQGNAKVVKLANGKLAYDHNGQRGGEVVYNTMRTPRGGQYQVTLPDGSKVWLNAASSITYPTAFTGKERRVKITGEVYFEVNSLNAQSPFYVNIMSEEGKQKDELVVLGTSFNVNAYDNEDVVKTSLLEGKVLILRQEQKIPITVGYQARMGEIIEMERADMEEVTAWKDGYFKFSQANIGLVMRQAERWYDIETDFPRGIPSDAFSGTLPRHVSLEQFLQILVYSDINAVIKDRRVIVNSK